LWPPALSVSTGELAGWSRFGSFKTVDADDFRHQRGGCLLADPRDGFDLLMWSRRQDVEGLFRRTLVHARGFLAAADRVDRLAD
jgi:hypothetical protein